MMKKKLTGYDVMCYFFSYICAVLREELWTD